MANDDFLNSPWTILHGAAGIPMPSGWTPFGDVNQSQNGAAAIQANPTPLDFPGPATGTPYPYGLSSLPQPVPVPPPPTSGPPPPTDQQLGFDPNGHGEAYYAIRHPFDALNAKKLANDAIEQTKKRYPNDAGQYQNDEADAFRHAYWSYLMAQQLGVDRAKQFGDGYEIFRPNPDGERYMDLYNNRVGRNLAAPGGNADAADVIQNAIRNGQLRLKPY